MDFQSEGILLYAKQSGITSFTSLWAAKRAVNTTKIGHTGTLDNFADGLLVVLVNRMRKLSARITDFDKTYEAVIRFGRQTDTLDIDGNFTAEMPLPEEKNFRLAAQKFTGSFDQLPPIYSAIQIGGSRASALARGGNAPELKKRPVTVHSLDILAFTGEFAHIRVRCTKGTYIRSLARDIAESAGSCGYLAALRRTACGPFLLENAAGFELLPEFGVEQAANRLSRIALSGKEPPSGLPEPSKEAICASIQKFTPCIAAQCGFTPVFIRQDFLADFLTGKKIQKNWFPPVEDVSSPFAVFGCRNETDESDKSFCGLVEKNGRRFEYVFVLQDEQPRANPLKPLRAVHPGGGRS